MEFNYETLTELENELVYPSFSRADAMELGTILYRESFQYGFPIAVEITINGLVVYRCFQDGVAPQSDKWLAYKRNVVEAQGMGSLRFGMLLEKNGETPEDCKMDPSTSACGGGGMQILIQDTGMIGSICVSGCPDHLVDQEIITNGMRTLLLQKTGK